MEISELRPGEMLVKDFTAAVKTLPASTLLSYTHAHAHTHYISL